MACTGPLLSILVSITSATNKYIINDKEALQLETDEGQSFSFIHSTRAKLVDLSVHSIIHSGYFYSASPSPLLLRGTPDTAQIPCRSFTPQATASEGLAQGPYVATRAGFEPTTLRTKGNDSTNEPLSLVFRQPWA